MAVTKLRADAPPFRLSPSCHLQFPTPPPPHLMAASPYHPVPCSPPFPVVPTNPLPSFPVVPTFPLPPFPGPAAPPIYGFPWPPHPPAPVCFPAKLLPPPPRRKARVSFLRPRKGVYSPRPKLPAGTGAFLVKDVPSPPPTPKKVALLSREALPPGTPPHKLMLFLGGGAVAEKLQEQAAMARAAEPVKPGQDLAPAPASGPRHGQRVASPRSLLGPPPRAAWSGGGKVKGVGRRQAKSPAGSPSPSFTTSPPYPITGPEWRKEPVTTVMIRNIPNKLKPCEMVQLLDEHCARANGKKKKKAGAVVAAYDFVYLPMDFSKCSSNMGYAFVNLTTPDAARGLHYALHGARWKVHGTKKVIHICAARIQGKEALVSHFSGSTFPCHTDEYLPAAFSPPRDGASASAAVTPPTTATHVGTRVHRTAPPAPRPLLPVPSPPQQLEWRRVERVVVHEAA